MDETAGATTEMTQPIIIDLGKQKTKNIKALKKGEGMLWDEMLGVVEEVKDKLGEEAGDKVFIPVVMIYRQKPKRQRPNMAFFPFAR